MTALIDTLLLFSLPASGKSEVRRYLASLSPAQCRDDFGLGPTAQLDDYPYVHLMHRIDDELVNLGYKQLYYKGPTRPFQDDWSWAVLVELLEGRDVPMGRPQIDYATAMVKERFIETHVLFAVQQLVRGVLAAITGIVQGVAAILPVPGLEQFVGLVAHELGHSFLFHHWEWTRTRAFRHAFGEVDKAYRGMDNTWVYFQRRGVAIDPPDHVSTYAAKHPQEDFA